MDTGFSSEVTVIKYDINKQQEAQGPWRSAWTEDPVHKNILKSCK